TPPTTSSRLPYTALFRPRDPRLLRYRLVERARRGHQRPTRAPARHRARLPEPGPLHLAVTDPLRTAPRTHPRTLNPEEPPNPTRSEEHTSELQSRFDLVC